MRYSSLDIINYMNSLTYQNQSQNISTIPYSIPGSNIQNYSNLGQNNIQVQSIQPQIFQQQLSNPISNIGIASSIQPNYQTINPQYTQILGNQNLGNEQINIISNQFSTQSLQTNPYSINQNSNQIIVAQNSEIQGLNQQYMPLLSQKTSENSPLYPSQFPITSQILPTTQLSNNQNLNPIIIDQNTNSFQTVNSITTSNAILGQHNLLNNQVIPSVGQIISQPVSIAPLGINSNTVIQGQNVGINNSIQPTTIQNYNQIFPNVENQVNFSNQSLNTQGISSLGIGIAQPIQNTIYNTMGSYHQLVSQESYAATSLQNGIQAINQINPQIIGQVQQVQPIIPSTSQTVNIAYPQIASQDPTIQATFPVSIPTMNQNVNPVVNQEFNLSTLSNQVLTSQQNVIQGNMIPSGISLPIAGQATAVVNTTGEESINIVVSPPKIDTGLQYMGPNPAMFEYFSSYMPPQIVQEGVLPQQNQFEEKFNPLPPQESNQLVPNTFELTFKGSNYSSNPLYQESLENPKEEKEVKENSIESGLQKEINNDEIKESSKNEEEDSGFFSKKK